MTARLTTTLTRLAPRAASRASAALGGRSDRGDVPGWVLITLMTAGLVTLLWGVAGDQLEALFTEAIGSVSGPSGR
ncbi:hypothetical protein [Intrasporangium sp. DVR]|uniref:hypothetical protein n=1 Tax=Intrasporangium sp. DVR TaxID=3127867 RepID=UPI00313A4FEC